MKKNILVLLILFICTLSLFGCNNEKTVSNNLDGLTIISTVFPGYDFARQICNENANISMLIPPGSESHSYEPTPQDIINIQNCDLFIYAGGESDTWVDNILDSLDKDINTIKLMDCVTTLEEEEEDSGEIEYDEHVWTSPSNAIEIVNGLTKKLCEIDSENEASYTEASQIYINELTLLDSDFATFFDTVTNKTLVFGDRFPFRYFAKEYGIKYYAAFPGCNTDTEPSAATIAELIDTIKNQNITTIFYIEFSNHSVADAIAEDTETKTAMLHSCHNVSSDDLNNGATYISLMRQNLDSLKEAMN